MNLENVSGEFIIKFSSAILKFEVAISSSAKIQPAYTLSSDNPSPQTESSVGKREVLMYLNHLYFRTQYCGWDSYWTFIHDQTSVRALC